MVCVHCSGNTHVINSRPQKRTNHVWRRRQCLQCQAVFTTEESATYDATWVVQAADGTLAPFSRDKLFMSLHASCAHRADALSNAASLCETVMAKLSDTVQAGMIPRKAIVQTAQVALNRFDTAASTHYRAFHPVN